MMWFCIGLRFSHQSLRFTERRIFHVAQGEESGQEALNSKFDNLWHGEDVGKNFHTNDNAGL